METPQYPPPKKIVLKQVGPQPLRKCGHPFLPTLDIPAEDGLSITGYCLFCIIKKLDLKPVIKITVNKPEDWRDKKKIKILFNE